MCPRVVCEFPLCGDIPGSGMAARTCRLESASELASSVAMAGRLGFDWHNHYSITLRYYRPAERFTTGTLLPRTGYNGGRGGPSGRTYTGNRPPNAGRTGVYNRPGGTSRPFEGDNRAARGYAEPHGQTGTRSGAFSNYDHGGETRSYSSRGSASFGGARGGGGAPHGGGGGGGRH
jgi:hypothetical protein